MLDNSVRSVVRRSLGMKVTPVPPETLSVKDAVRKSLRMGVSLAPVELESLHSMVRRSVGSKQPSTEPVSHIYGVQCPNCGNSNIFLTKKGKCPICKFTPK